LIAHVVDQLIGMQRLTAYGGGAGSLLRLFVLAVIMLPIMAVVMLRAQVPEARAALTAIRRRIGARPDAAPARKRAMPAPAGQAPSHAPAQPPPRTSINAVPRGPGAPDQLLRPRHFTYPEQRNSITPGGYPARQPDWRGLPTPVAGEGMRKGPGMTDRPSDNTSANPVSETESHRQPASSPAASDGPILPREREVPPPRAASRPASSPAVDDFQPDVPPDLQVGTVPPPEPSRPNVGAADPIEFDAPREPTAEQPPTDDDQHLVPGASIARGRYRLLVFHGGAPHLQFWQALDTALDRQVSLTFVDPDGALSDEQVREILSRTMRLSRVDKLGIARVLDVVHTGTGGLVVAEWIRGGSLQEVADTSPSAVGAARAMQTLAAAAEAAHHAGVALSIDHPSRVRVSVEGDVVLAFPATTPEATPEDDIRGIGAALYALLVNRWPLTESGERSGMAPAPRDAAGQPVEPSAIDREIPFQISAAATHSIQGDGGIRSAATLLNLLQQATAVADRTELLSPLPDPPPAPARPGRIRTPQLEDAQARVRRRRAVTIGIGVGAAIIVVALLVLASVLSRMFGDVGGLDKDQLGLNAPSQSSSASGSAPAGSVVKPVSATVFSPGGDPDNPGEAAKAIDGDPATAWETDTYHDAVPFPTFKSGVGLLLQLPKPTVVGAVNLDLASTGTKIQIRSSATATPGKLDNTTALTQPAAMKPGHNSIPVKASAPTSYLLVWIPTLGTTNGESRSGLSDITVQAAS
jgi:putative peptidoglycan lipid II flippase